MKCQRHPHGNMLIFTVCVTALIFVPIFMMIGQYAPYFISSGRAQDTVEAAVKIAAMDLSRIVINDPNFGYVSLSNHAATGTGTCAEDGEPLPVTGINTLVATLRQNAIVADELDNETMMSLVDRDLNSLHGTVKELNITLEEATSGLSRRRRPVDSSGNLVDPIQDVEHFLVDNLPRNVRLESVKLSLGWLDGGSSTAVSIPQPAKLGQVGAEEIRLGQYEAFKNYPVAGRAFFFAGLDSQAHLVSGRKFRPFDSKQICSIVKLECNVAPVDPTKPKFVCTAYCQPFSKPDRSTHGAMTVRFPGRPVPGLLSWKEFLSYNSFRDNKVISFDVVAGDYPFETEAHMSQSDTPDGIGTSEQFAEHLYNWLRNGHARGRLDCILSMINEPFRLSANEIYIYSVAEDGSIDRNIVSGARFTLPVAADGQSTVMADTRVRNGSNAVILFRDNVAKLGSDGGKHAGQPLAGYPLCNLDSMPDLHKLATNFSRRNEFRDGLALDIEIGGTGDSTASNDIISMRQRTRSRRI